MSVSPPPGRWERSRTIWRLPSPPPPARYARPPCAERRRGRCGRSTMRTTRGSESACCPASRSNRKLATPAPDFGAERARALDHLEVVHQLLGFADVVPAEELFHALGDGRGHGRSLL